MGAVAPLAAWNLAEWDAAEGYEERHVELVAGIPIVSPGESLGIRLVCDAVLAVLRAAVPAGWVAVSEIEVTVSGDPVPTVRRPDVTVLRASAPVDAARHDPAEVALVAEVVSPTSRERDWVTKAREYATAGVPAYLVVDPATPVLALFVDPGPGGYARRRDDGVRGTWILDGQVVTVDVADVLGG